MNRSTIIDLLILEILAIALVAYSFRGATSTCDGFMHLSMVRIIMNTFPQIPRWNQYWYFGMPMLRAYSPLSYYIMAFLGWVFKLSITEIIMSMSYVVFSIAAISAYILALELGLSRLGRLSSGVLFLTAFNLRAYWAIGSYPNVLAAAFSPVAFTLFVRAAKRRTPIDLFVAGMAYAVVALTYFPNVLVAGVITISISIALILENHELLYISRGQKAPPKYTLILPKLLFAVILIALALSAWWVVPFVNAYVNASSPLGTPTLSVPAAGYPIEQQLWLLSFEAGSLFSPGAGHFILAFTGCLFVIKNRRDHSAVVPLCLIVAFCFLLSPWLRIPAEPISFIRFALYYSLFVSLAGGFAIMFVRDFYERNLNKTIYPMFFSGLILLATIYPVVGPGTFWDGADTSIPSDLKAFNELTSGTAPLDRVAIDGGYGLNLFSNVTQTGGGSIESMYLLNDFAYTFWYYIFSKPDPRYLPYFARNYEVRWFMSSWMPGLAEIGPGLPYEVTGTNLGFAEVLGPSTIEVLFFGDWTEYTRIFISLALANPQDILLAYGGKNVERYDLAVLKKFDVIYLEGLRYGTQESLLGISRLLSEYVRGGGAVILDTGNLPYGGKMNDIPDPFPVRQTAIYNYSKIELGYVIQHNITEGVDFKKFGTTEPQAISYELAAKDGTTTLLYDEDRPVVAYWEQGLGKVLWTGLRLTYQIMLNDNEEGARFLAKTLHFMSRVSYETEGSVAKIENPNPEELLVTVRDAGAEEAIWVKTAYYPGWTAQVVGPESKQLKIFIAGPNMILVFPEKTGDYTLRFYFDKTIDVQVGEIISLSGLLLPLIILAYSYVRRQRSMPANSWNKTEHKGTGIRARANSHTDPS